MSVKTQLVLVRQCFPVYQILETSESIGSLLSTGVNEANIIVLLTGQITAQIPNLSKF
jgi:hypothetical protein